MSDSETNTGRRSFFKYSAVALGAFFISSRKGEFLGSLSFAESLKPLQETDATASSLGYHVNAAKVDPAKWPKRSGDGAKEQKCSSCMFYTKIDNKVGKCQIFPANSVTAEGWCNTWSKKQ